MAKNILKEAIADAKAVREVALANAKAALEEAFTPKLQSMLSAKLSETLNEEEDELEENFMDETHVDEIAGMDEEEKEGADLDEEIDLEEILNELELEEGEDSKEETVDEAKDEDLDEAKEETNEADDKDLDEAKDDELEEVQRVGQPNYKGDETHDVLNKASDAHQGLKEDKAFDLDALLEEINNLDETEEETNESVTAAITMGVAGIVVGGTPLLLAKGAWDYVTDPERKAELEQKYPKLANLMNTLGVIGKGAADSKANVHGGREEGLQEGDGKVASEEQLANMEKALAEIMGENTHQEQIAELKAALEVKSSELNEVNLLNSKLLYVNRIFKANTLDEGQKLRVVETLDNAETIKEAKLIYNTIKDTFNVAKTSKRSFQNKTKSLKEGIGMASRAAGTSTAPKKEVITESSDMINRFQKLANIKINQ